MKLLRNSLIALALTTSLFAGSYSVDVSHSNVGFKVKHMMISSVRGNFKDFSGEFEYDKKSGKLVSLSGVVKAASIDTDIEKRDNHLRSADFFDVVKFPEIKFNLTRIKGDKAYGDLTIHGVTKNVKFDIEMGGTVKDPWGNSRVGFELEGKLNREDYGLTWNKLLESGGVVVGKKVKLYIEIEGILNK